MRIPASISQFRAGCGEKRRGFEDIGYSDHADLKMKTGQLAGMTSLIEAEIISFAVSSASKSAPSA
jgi:hypothetical protein